MSAKKLLISFVLLTMVTPAFGYEEIECSSDAVFSANSCGQCFDGWTKGQWEYVWLLSDDWINNTETKKLLFKEQQEFPQMINLASESVTWSQDPSNEDFWEYTPEFNNLFSADEEGYILDAGQTVTWLRSKVWYAYKLDTNTVPLDGNVGLLVFPITVHSIGTDGDIGVDDEELNECVLYKSGEPGVDTMPAEPKKLPDTGPAEFMLLALLAMILGLGVLKVRANS